MGHDHSHAHRVEGNEKRLLWALGLTALFMVVEIVGGIVTNSLALLSDAAHMFTDVTALAISLAAVQVGERPVDDERSFGYQRFEILAAAFNALLLFGVAAYILYEAWRRFIEPPEVNSNGMLAIAVVGLIVNLVSMKLLSGGREGSLNVKGAYLEVWSDMLGSAGVIAAAVAIHFTEWLWLDPVVAIGIGLWVLPRTWTLLKSSTHILLEGTPAEIDIGKLRAMIESKPGVATVHDLHVWSLTSGRYVLTAHVVCAPDAPGSLLKSLSEEIRDRFEIFHTTIQIEDEECGDMHAATPLRRRSAAGAHDHPDHDHHDHHHHDHDRGAHGKH
ncbi:MAG: cation diffusion facilitator family transporter [Bacillota bacterium]